MAFRAPLAEMENAGLNVEILPDEVTFLFVLLSLLSLLLLYILALFI